MSGILIVEGVTGSGKSTLVAKLVSERPDTLVIYETETLGTIMDDKKNRPDMPADLSALETVIKQIREERILRPERPIIIERFHLTTYALFGNWESLHKFDDELVSLGATVILLTIPEGEIERRSIDRVDEPGYADVMIKYYGSRESAIIAVKESQRRRLEAATLTKLKVLIKP
jgi:GTPase SAR1 family protein